VLGHVDNTTKTNFWHPFLRRNFTAGDEEDEEEITNMPFSQPEQVTPSETITRREFLQRSAATVAAAAVWRAPIFAGEEPPPNVVLINADDLGYGDLGCYGSEQIATPNLDRLAQEGMRFTDFYACAPVCTPSRAGLLTGRYPVRTGLTRVLFPRSQTGIDASEVTLAEALKEKGYTTACVGKWHLGHLPPFLPTRHGFDEYYGIPYSNDMTPTPLLEGEETIEEPAHQETLVERYTERAIQFIQGHQDRPFFLYLPHTMPHVPLHIAERFRGRSPRGLYGDVVEAIDWGVGEIVKAIRELQLERRTLVLFTSDNGPWLVQKEHGGSAGPLREGKGTVFEGGMRVPMIAAWPGSISPGQVCREPASNLDLFTTLIALADGKVPEDRPIDGRNIWPLLTGDGKMDGDHAFFYHRSESLNAVRVGRWKLHVGRGDKALPEPELYDLEADLGETKNVAKEHPDRVAELQARIETFRQSFTPAPVKT
jgi:arylsulfatase A-like enzyme